MKVLFPSGSKQPTRDEVESWIKNRGEPCEDAEDCIQLRALPLRIVAPKDGGLYKALVNVTPSVDLNRLVDLIFELSVFLGGDVRVRHIDSATRQTLWLHMADEQDRLRIQQSLMLAEDQGKHEEVVRKLWSIISSFRVGHDDRWDALSQRIVEMVEVSEKGNNLEDMRKIDANAQIGEIVAVPLPGNFYHTLAWRWLSEAYPGLQDHEVTLH